MKKRLNGSIILFVMFAFVCLAAIQPNKLQAEESGIQVHFYNSLGWENVYIYSWSENTNAEKLTPMTASASENWYEFTFSKEMGSDFEFLFYNGDWQDYNQSENIMMSAEKDTYFVPQAELIVSEFSSSAAIKVYPDEVAAAAAGYPVYVPDDSKKETPTKSEANPLTVYFKNVLEWKKAGINAWGDNAASMQEMTDLGNGWFSYVFETPVSNVYNFMFFDVDAFASETYGAGHQTGDIKEYTVQTDAIWIVPSDSGDISGGPLLTAEAGWPGAVEEPEKKPEESIEPTKIYFYNSSDWKQINVWAWEMKYTDQLVANIWPGDPMTDLGNGWFLYELKANEPFGILFNNGESGAGNQTADSIDLINSKTYWFAPEDGEVLNENGIGGGSAVTAFTEPKAGWPEGPKAEEEVTVEPTKPVEPTVSEPTTIPEDTAVDGSNVKDDTKGSQTWIWIVVIVVVCGGALAGVGIIVSKKKKK